MLKRDEWLDLARKLDWDFSYVTEEEAFPPVASGKPWLPRSAWESWDEPFRTTYAEYVTQQSSKDAALYAVRDAVGRADDARKLPPGWLNAVKLHAATLPLAEFAAVIGNLRAARFGRDSAWRQTALFGALDELRHTQIPLAVIHELLRLDGQFDWTHRFYHSNNWVAIAARHVFDEMLLASDPIELAIGCNFVFETGFTNLQFVGLTTLARDVGDTMFERMLATIQSDEARHAQIGEPVLRVVAREDPAYAQRLVDKWFWRSWRLFAVVTGFSMDYLTPLERRRLSFKDFVEEWILDQFTRQLTEAGLARPWYWETFLKEIETYHHMVYASAYTYRASVWFDFVAVGPRERSWLRHKYPRTWPAFEPIWARIQEGWQNADPGNDFAVHGSAIVTFCNLCQIVLCGGSPEKNTANTLTFEGKKYIFCSEPCRWIFEQETARYAGHKDVVKRVLAGEAPANLVAMLRRYFGLEHATWGRDAFGGVYPWLEREPRGPTADGEGR
jgi:toluene monooxygenase system protein A